MADQAQRGYYRQQIIIRYNVAAESAGDNNNNPGARLWIYNYGSDGVKIERHITDSNSSFQDWVITYNDKSVYLRQVSDASGEPLEEWYVFHSDDMAEAGASYACVKGFLAAQLKVLELLGVEL